MAVLIPLLVTAALVIGTAAGFWFAIQRRGVRVLFGILALAMLAVGTYLGLVVAPPEREMGDVYRIIYMHVPAAWMCLLCVTINFGACVAYLLKATWGRDCFAEATAEVGVAFALIAIILGSIWARPTWGVYWTWDPRLTTFAILIVAYSGYLVLRSFIDDPERRAVWSAVVGIIAGVDVPIVYFSVKWWNSLHQLQSSPETVDKPMVFPLRWNAFAFLFATIFFIAVRYGIARAVRADEVALPEELPPAKPSEAA